MEVVVIATLDTKGAEAAFVCDRLRELGLVVRLMDVGCKGEPSAVADIDRDAVFQAAGADRAELERLGDRGRAVTVAAEGAAILVAKAHGRGELAGVLGLGGSAGTTIATTAMQVLPLGLPKVMLSTMASGDVRGFVGPKDIVMIHSVVDIAGLNRISRCVLAEAAAALAGMVKFRADPRHADDRPLVAATMFGVTTPCVERARQVLEEAGYEVLVFHATGSGGRAMEGLIADGLIRGVLDLTTTELADHWVGGVLSAGPDRLTAAACYGVPQVVSVGATDMVNFWSLPTVPQPFQNRTLHRHNANVTLMRTSAEECERIGADLGRKVNQARGPAIVLLPSRGVSALDQEGQPFNDPVARQRLFDAIRQECPRVPVEQLDYHINDPKFAEAAAARLIGLMEGDTA